MAKTMQVAIVALAFALAVAVTADPQPPTLPNLWTSHINMFVAPATYFTGAMYVDYTTGMQRTDIVMPPMVLSVFENFDSSGKFSSPQTTLAYLPATQNKQVCSKQATSGSVIGQDALAKAEFVGVGNWYGTNAYIWSAHGEGQVYSAYTAIDSGALVALETYNATTNSLDVVISFSGFTDSIASGVFTIPDMPCPSNGIAAASHGKNANMELLRKTLNLA
ncbi:uncharacterized protein AMSG_11088 [Thecamonas trahens ATCC 50062]|uniref:Uncharacterized protein n=1 Tax=Thecamonas trahens ATCC 50062 TaxID=461836 RepID=A0A0L0DT75_THETB|nr:hypothetical protein AMSG_11088 [Thecamonas trahens ATCC 50062]KNC55427.1 hypothetical protein AMSG_11088 [Thecamonas trahens ATCC 50062]|eukprot:XP_013752965.1 hypothetical protein AMSG_11088 [Thecamonas trahens ATCC 50062]